MSPLTNKLVQPAGTTGLVTLAETLGDACVWVGALVAPTAGETSTVCVSTTVVVAAVVSAGVAGSVILDVVVRVTVSTTLPATVGVTSIPPFGLGVTTAVGSVAATIGVGTDEADGVASASVPVITLVAVTADVAVGSLVELTVGIATGVAVFVDSVVAGVSVDVAAATVSVGVTTDVSGFVLAVLTTT